MDQARLGDYRQSEDAERDAQKRSSKPRYYVDERVGCIAVRDRQNTDPDYPGLHADTPGVVRYRRGELNRQTCPHCHQEMNGAWMISEADRLDARAECARLNAEDERAEQAHHASTGE